MSKSDPILGEKVRQHLIKLNLETPVLADPKIKMALDKRNKITNAMATVLSTLGMDLEDDSIQDTPRRVAKMYVDEIFYGLSYDNFPKCSTFKNKMKFDEMVCVRDILVRSVCEHHLVPFIGKATIAYIPKGNIIGLSKLNRIVDFFCRRPQVQERLTEQVCAALSYVLKTQDVAVVMDAEHFCVKLRGVQDPHSSTITSKLSGRFKSVPELRNEFLQLHNSRGC